MKSLDEFNAERRAIYDDMFSNEPVKNGIACPKCGMELFDSSPMMVFTSNPPQKKVHCFNCKYSGYRIA